VKPVERDIAGSRRRRHLSPGVGTTPATGAEADRRGRGGMD